MTIRVLIADDHGVIRGGLRSLVNSEPDLQVVAECGDGNEALQRAIELRPDIVLMDISMPGCGGIEATQRLSMALPDTHVLILTVHEDESLLKEAIRAGAAGYIIKRAAEYELIHAIHVVFRGDMYVHPALTRALVKDLSPIPAPQEVSMELLTPREMAVLRLLVRGYTNRQIAQELNLSARTIEGHRANLMSKLGLHSRVELVNYVEQYGLLDESR
jgi:two-component system response regulator NreC